MAATTSPPPPPPSSASTVADQKALGNEQFQQGKFAEAVQSFSAAIELSADSSQEVHVLYSNRSGAHASLKNYRKALEDAQTCVTLKPDWAKGYSRKGLALVHLGENEAAEKAYKQGLEIDPNNAALKDGLQKAQRSKGNLDDIQLMISVMHAVNSKPHLQKYSEEDPLYVEKITGLIRHLRTNPEDLGSLMRDPDHRLREGLMTALGSTMGSTKEGESPHPPRSPPRQDQNKSNEPQRTQTEKEADEWKDKGNVLYKQREFKEALEAYDKAIEINPADISYHSNKGAVYIEMGEYDQCIEECEKALSKRNEMKATFSKVAKVYIRMAACYERQGRYSETAAMYEKALLEDNNRTTRNALKDIRRLKEKKDKDDYLDPQKAEEHREKGNTCFKEGDYPKAKKEYDESILRNPKDAKIYGNRAAALTKLGEFPGALKDCEVALVLDPTFVKCWIRKGNLHVSLKENHKAMDAFAKALELDPSNSEARDGRMNVMMKIQQTSRSSEVDQEQYRHAMADPEIQQILSDPQFNMILKEITENPSSLQAYMNDPKIAAGISKLMSAGILRTG
eukprot:GHVS01058602.1.p1 GENE.GHVS01058602.1~~GHVS01058602.1.p1  ORF type:complete len:567 (-),score=104.88 GHVS01058602.1:102-1802(-)